MTLVTKAEAQRRKLIDKAAAELAAKEQPAAPVTGQEFTEINYQGNLRGTDFMWGVHAAGCADISKEVQRQFGSKAKGKTEYLLTNHTAASMRELLDAIVDGETRGLGWGDDNVKVHDCVKFPKASNKAKPAAAPVLTVVQGQIPAGQKLCPTCKLVKDLDQFASDISNKVDGRYYACKACGKIARERQKANREAKATAALQAAATEQPKKARKAKAAKAR